MLTGAALPSFSWMFGPSGAAGALGAGPREAGTVRHNRLASFTHAHACPIVALSATPGTGLAAPFAASAIQRAIPVAFVSVKATLRLFGEKPIQSMRAAAGTASFTVFPSAIATSEMPVSAGGRCGPFVRGLMRAPARRSIGWERSAIDGMLARSSSAMTWRDGLTATVGSGRASRMSTTTFGGSWYRAWANAVSPPRARQAAATIDSWISGRTRPPPSAFRHGESIRRIPGSPW